MTPIREVIESIDPRIIVASLCGATTILACFYLAIDYYALHRGLSLLDESYYLLSYKMAGEHTYAHFHNTPFLVAFFTEWLHPGVVFYRLAHFVLATCGAALLVAAILSYLRDTAYGQRALLTALLVALATCFVPLAYYISYATLSYNHVNEFLVLVSEALLLLAPRTRHSAWFCLASGVIASADIYVKPLTFLLLGVVDICLISAIFYGQSPWRKHIPFFLLGGVVGLAASVVLFFHPSDWLNYAQFMQAQRPHSIGTVLPMFFVSMKNLLPRTIYFIFSSLAFMVGLHWCHYYSSTESRGRFFVIGFAFLCTELVILTINHIILPPYLSQSFSAGWVYWWNYSCRFFTVVTMLCGSTGLILLWLRRTSNENRRFGIVLIMLALNPLIMAIGTLNGFGQVQTAGLSWLCFDGIVLFLLLERAAILPSIYMAFLILITICISGMYMVRQCAPLNVNGEDALYEQIHPVPELPLLHDVLVDAQTHDLLIAINTVLQKYPNSKTVVFFDMPGLQYVFGRPWIVWEPWLTDLDVPETRDDVYNCRIITQDKAALKDSIFIVAHDEDISPGLRDCLATIGYPNDMVLLATIDTKTARLKTPVKMYLHK